MSTDSAMAIAMKNIALILPYKAADTRISTNRARAVTVDHATAGADETYEAADARTASSDINVIHTYVQNPAP